MMLLFLTFLIQAPLQEAAIDEQIGRFIKGDPAARAELVKLGAFAIRPLHRVQGKDPDAVDALIYELKKSAAHPKCLEVIGLLEYPIAPNLSDIKAESAAPMIQNMGLPVFADAIDFQRLKGKTFTIRQRGVPARLILDEICRQTGLDYGLFHNHVVIGHPENLWPAGPPVKAPDLDAEALARAKGLVEKLGDEAIAVRESAMQELIALGPGIMKLLESNLARKESEISARCAALVERLRITVKGRFGPCGVDRQELSGDDEKLLERLRAFKAAVSFNRQTIREIAAHFGRIDGIPVDVEAAVPDTPITVSMKAQHVHDILALITQSQGLDFTIRNGRIRIESQPAPPKE
jgi:hypothetical protein